MLISYDLNLVILSVIIAILSAYTALDLTGRIATTKGAAWIGWLLGGAVSFGIGIWSMHFVGMLAFNPSIPISYDVRIVLLSIIPAILSSGLALYIASRTILQIPKLLVASLLMGIGITTMHYTGMAAMQLPSNYTYDLRLVITSAAIAVAVSLVALRLIHHLQSQETTVWWQKIGAAALMGVAVPIMHYTGMAAVSFSSGESFSGEFPASNTTWLASLTSVGTFFILGLALITSSETKVFERTKELSCTLKQLQDSQLQLIQSEKMSDLGQLVAGIAHEINNPVNFIHGNIDYISTYTQDLLRVVQAYQTHYLDPPPSLQSTLDEVELDFLEKDLDKLLQSIRVGTDRIRQIVLSLRNFSRLDESEFKVVNLHEGIDNTLLILQHRLKAKPELPAIELIKDYGQLPLVECYAGQLNQVFMNLVANAIDALEETASKQIKAGTLGDKKTIWISTQIKNQDWVQIMIADNGLGISESARSRIFDPFFTTKPLGKGTGLGLSISYQIITEKHQGKMWCDSVMGEGAKFVIEIPVRQLKPAPV